MVIAEFSRETMRTRANQYELKYPLGNFCAKQLQCGTYDNNFDGHQIFAELISTHQAWEKSHAIENTMALMQDHVCRKYLEHPKAAIVSRFSASGWNQLHRGIPGPLRCHCAGTNNHLRRHLSLVLPLPRNDSTEEATCACNSGR